MPELRVAQLFPKVAQNVAKKFFLSYLKNRPIWSHCMQTNPRHTFMERNTQTYDYSLVKEPSPTHTSCFHLSHTQTASDYH